MAINGDESGNGKADLANKHETKHDVDGKIEKEKKSGLKKKAHKVREKEKKEIERLKSELTQLRDQYLRKAAEFENFRKRKEKEILESWEIAKADLIKKFLPAFDDLDRTLESAKKDENFDALVLGLELVNKAFLKVLEDEEVEAIAAVGEPFNPEFHEALLQMEKEDVESNIVIDESQKGYKKGTRILRPAKVVVSK
ncbi:MAG: nucleotide exchange factor GrpE [bacterium]